MPIVEGVRVVSRICRVSLAREQEIAEYWREIERVRAVKRLRRALKPALRQAQGSCVAMEPTADEREQHRELSVDLHGRLAADGIELDEAGTAAVGKQLWAWLRLRRRTPWHKFVEAVAAAHAGPQWGQPSAHGMAQQPGARDQGW